LLKLQITIFGAAVSVKVFPSALRSLPPAAIPQQYGALSSVFPHFDEESVHEVPMLVSVGFAGAGGLTGDGGAGALKH